MTVSDVSSYLNNDSNGIIWDEELCGRLNNPKCIEKYGFKVYSQNDEDGIIEEIFNRIGATNKVFIEFGVQDGIESNGHYLLLKGWKGLWIECDDESYRRIMTKFESVIKAGKLKVAYDFITRDNINRIFEEHNVVGEIDLLSIDIDGNDYHVWKAIQAVRPRVVVIEYNAKMPPSCEWVMPYCEQHMWDGGDKHGASLLALAGLAREKDYTLVGTNISGVNAFFVRNDCLGDRFSNLNVEKLYNPPRFYKKYYSGHPSLYCLGELPQGRKQLFCGYAGEVLFRQGFHPQENTAGIMRWMSQSRGILWIRDEGNLLKGIVLKLENPASSSRGEGVPGRVIIKMEGTTVHDCEFNRTEGAFAVEIDREKCKNDEVIELEIETDCLWSPCDVGMGEDARRLGLYVRAVECRTM